MPEKLSRIGDESFSGCSGLNIELKLPRGLKYIGREAFLGCINLQGDIYLPVGLMEIGDKAFAGCCNLSRNLYLPSSIRRIGAYAFCYDYKQKGSGENHISLDAVMEEKATTVGKIFFSEKTTVISNRAFIDCTGLYGELQIREGITTIGDWAFKGCTNISGKLSFPKSLTKIGNNAFDGCSGLTGEIRFRENLTDIGEYAFRGCSHLSGKLELPDSLKEVKAATFSGCSDLSGELKLPANLRTIGNRAFMNCTGLNCGIAFPDTLALVGDFAFKNCRKLSGTLNLCESMVFIGDNAFEGCSGLTGEVRLPESMLSVGKEAFAGCSGLKTNALKLKSYESRKYVKSFLNNSEPLNECKVIFLGDGGAGKSLIIHRLMNDGAPVPDFRGDSTPGIQICNHEEYIGVDRFQIHYWDFGGQEILHSMHRMFMTKRTLYVIVVNARGNMQDESANYWLHDVSIYAPESPVLLVINQIDQNPAASINETRLREQYPQLLATVKISARDFDKNKFKNDFIAILHKYIKKVPGVYALFPVKWRSLFDHVRKENTNFIYKSRFIELCKANKIDDFEDIQQILIRKIRELGVGFLYGKNVYADDGMLLKPVWLLNAIYIILFNGSKFTDNKEKNGGNGVLSHQLIEKMLLNPDYDDDEIRKVVKDEKYEKNDVEYILSVIRQYRLSYKVGDDADFFPMLCDRNENSSSWNGDDENTLHMILRYKYKPLDIFHRLIIEMHKDLDMEKVWFSGALMKNTDDNVIAYINVQGNDLHIRVKSDSDNKSANRYLLIIHNQISAINELLGVTADELVVYQKDGKESEFYFDDLKGSEEAGIEYIYSRVHESKICVKDILYYSDSNLREYHQKLLAALIEALQKLQNNYVYHWRIEDDRNTYVRDLLEMRSYICKDQSRGGLSESKTRDGERDIVILDTNRKWSTIYEALNLRSFDNEAQKDLDRHISKLLDNYNPIGFPILYLVVYAEWAPDKFDENKQKYFEHVKSYSNNHFTVKNSNSMEHGEGQYLYHAKVLYDCGGIPFTIHHIVVRVGDVDNDNLMQSVYDLAKTKGQITRKEVEESCGINETKARAIINRLCKEEQLLKQGKGQHIIYIFSGHKA